MVVSCRGPLQKELIARGLVPDHCRLIDLVISVDGALIIKYEVFVSADDLEKFGAAFVAAAQAITGTPRP